MLEGQSYQNILVGVDGSDQAMEAYKKAIAVAQRNNGKVYVANVIDQQFYNYMGYIPVSESVIDQQSADAKNLIQNCKEYAHSIGFTEVEGIVAYGSAKEAMAHTLPKRYEIDLVMVGQSGLNAVERFMTGSVASYIIRQAPCDVLIVYPTDENKE